MSRLPSPGGDDSIWGDLLNEFLTIEHNADGTHKGFVNPDATTTIKGKVKLAGDLSGTADVPTVPGLANKLDVSLLDTDGALTANSDSRLATQKAVKTYVNSVTTSGAPDATTSTKGILKLTNDLGGTADLPTVPGLAAKANNASVVHLTGAESISGVKTFSNSPIVPTPTSGTDVANKSYVDGAVTGTTIGGTIGSGTTGSVLFVGASSALAQDNPKFFYDSTNHRLGLGAAPTAISPFTSYALQITDDNGGNSDILARVASNGTISMAFASSGGTIASPTASTNGNGSLAMRSYGYGTSAYKESARILMAVDDTANGGTTPTDTNMPGTMVFSTTRVGATVPTEALRINSKQWVGLNNNIVASRLDVDGSFGLAIRTVTANYTAASDDHTIRADATSGSITITLPAMLGAARRIYVIKRVNTNANTVTVTTTSSQTIDTTGVTSVVLTNAFDYIVVQGATTGGNWTMLTSSLPTNANLVAWSAKTSPTGTVVGTTDTQVLTNKTVTLRVNTLTVASNTYTPNGDTTDEAKILSPTANFTLAAPTGTPVDRQKLVVTVKSGGTGFTPTFNAIYVSSGVATLPSSALPANKTVTMGFSYDSDVTKWVLRAIDDTGY